MHHSQVSPCSCWVATILHGLTILCSDWSEVSSGFCDLGWLSISINYMRRSVLWPIKLKLLGHGIFPSFHRHVQYAPFRSSFLLSMSSLCLRFSSSSGYAQLHLSTAGGMHHFGNNTLGAPPTLPAHHLEVSRSEVDAFGDAKVELTTARSMMVYPPLWYNHTELGRGLAIICLLIQLPLLPKKWGSLKSGNTIIYHPHSQNIHLVRAATPVLLVFYSILSFSLESCLLPPIPSPDSL